MWHLIAGGEDRKLQSLLQGPFARFCWDLDDNLRKMAISDFKNVEEMRGIGKTLYNCSEP